MLHFARWKIIVVLLVCVTGLAFTVPNFVAEKTLAEVPEWLPRKHMSLGLDLQGGSHLLMEFDLSLVIQARLDSMEDGMRDGLRKERIGYRDFGVRGDKVAITIRKPEQYAKALKIIEDLRQTVGVNPISGSLGGKDFEIAELDGGRLELTLSEFSIKEIEQSTMSQSVEIVRRRIDELGTREPVIQRQGSDRVLVQVAGFGDPERLKALLEKVAHMTFQMVDITADPTARTIRPGSERLPSDDRVDPNDPDSPPARYYVVRKKILVGGDRLKSAAPSYDQGQPVVAFTFDSVGAKKFADATSKNVGRPFAIVLDDKVISAPVIRSPILGGSGIITGGFTVKSANDLAILLNAGALPVKPQFLEQRTVGASLGADSVAAGKIASILAFVLVMVFMVLAYGRFGLAANVALIVNLFLIAGALSALQATLTLPGIAGIVLTIGMAVDANVLVFERIKEEVRTGKTPFAAMDAGYKRAFGTILDANITTFIAATILFAIGSGPIKGFAVTLGIGILTSVFTAVTVTRLMLVIWLRRTRPVALPL